MVIYRLKYNSKLITHDNCGNIRSGGYSLKPTGQKYIQGSRGGIPNHVNCIKNISCELYKKYIRFFKIQNLSLLREGLLNDPVSPKRVTTL